MFKKRRLILILFLSSICFAQDTNNVYENLVDAVKNANFVKFQELFVESDLSHEQKNNLLAMADTIIVTELKYWRPYRLGPISSIGQELKIGIFAGIVLGAGFALIAPFSVGWFLHEYFKGRAELLNEYQKIQNGQFMIFLNAALAAEHLDLVKSTWTHNMIARGIVCFSPIFWSALFLELTALNQRVLRSYKRWKKVCKIESLMEPGQKIYRNLGLITG